MVPTSRFMIRMITKENRLTIAASVVLLAIFSRAATTAAAESSPVLAVPASPVALQIARDLDPAVKPDAAGRWQLVEVDNPATTASVQLVPAMTADGQAAGQGRRLLAAIPPREGAGESRRFVLKPSEGVQPDSGGGFRLEDLDDKSLKLSDGPSPVLVYNHGLITREDVPENDARRTRGCYVHPVWGLNGEVLTDDFPRDHYHHHGIFWTWPHVKIEGQEYDLWADRGVQQRFVGWLSKEAGPVAGVIGVENGWFVGETKVMIERVWIRVYKPAGGSRPIDLEFAWIPVGKPITLWGAPDKSYGGLTMRFAPPASKDPKTVITVPSGPTTGDLPDTPLAWADFTSQFGDCPTRSGAAVFVAPNHPDYPPTWLTRYYGPLCVGWPGVNPKTFEPGKPIRLSYRVWIHKQAAETAEIQQAYDAYAAAMKAEWQ